MCAAPRHIQPRDLGSGGGTGEGCGPAMRGPAVKRSASRGVSKSKIPRRGDDGRLRPHFDSKPAAPQRAQSAVFASLDLLSFEVPHVADRRRVHEAENPLRAFRLGAAGVVSGTVLGADIDGGGSGQSRLGENLVELPAIV